MSLAETNNEAYQECDSCETTDYNQEDLPATHLVFYSDSTWSIFVDSEANFSIFEVKSGNEVAQECIS